MLKKKKSKKTIQKKNNNKQLAKLAKALGFFSPIGSGFRHSPIRQWLAWA